MNLPSLEIMRFDSLAACYAAIGNFWQSLVQTAIERQGYCTVALSGGTTPVALFQTLCRPPFSTTICWSKIFFFWGDERFLPLNHPDNNYNMAQKNLLAQLPIKKNHIFRMPTEIRPYTTAALHYQRVIATVFSALTAKKQPYAEGEYPSFDLILLGMGHDGHTASLFPGQSALKRTDWVAEVETPQALPPVPRLTLTLPVINNADTTLFFVNGLQKIKLAESFLSGRPQSCYPASLILPKRRLLWYLVS